MPSAPQPSHSTSTHSTHRVNRPHEDRCEHSDNKRDIATAAQSKKSQTVKKKRIIMKTQSALQLGEVKNGAGTREGRQHDATLSVQSCRLSSVN